VEQKLVGTWHIRYIPGDYVYRFFVPGRTFILPCFTYILLAGRVLIRASDTVYDNILYTQPIYRMDGFLPRI